MLFARGDENMFGSQVAGVAIGGGSASIVIAGVVLAWRGEWGLLADVGIVVGAVGFVLGVNAVVAFVDRAVGSRSRRPAQPSPAALGRGSGLPPVSARVVVAVRDAGVSDDPGRVGVCSVAPSRDAISLTAPMLSPVPDPRGLVEATGDGAVLTAVPSPRSVELRAIAVRAFGEQT